MIVLLHWLHAGVVILGVLVVVASVMPVWSVHRRRSASARGQDGRVAELRAAAEEGTLVRRAEARALAQLTHPDRAWSATGHLLVPTSAHIPLVAAAVSTLTGSAIYAGVGPDHFRGGVVVGFLAVAVAVVQCVQSALLVRRPTRFLLRSVIAGAAAVTAVLWLATRTVGVLGVAATLCEVVAAGCALYVLRGGASGRPAPAPSASPASPGQLAGTQAG